MADFYGNPNLYITALDTTAGITMSRTSGFVLVNNDGGPNVPAFVQVSAGSLTGVGGTYNGIGCTGVYKDTAGNTMPGTPMPYEDLEYTWDFGDPSGNETFSKPINNAGNKAEPTSVNANSGQRGPEAAYGYRNIGTGTYTITLTIRGKAAGGGYISAQVTANFTVSSFEAAHATKMYFDSNYGGGANDGSKAKPYTTHDDMHNHADFVSGIALYVAYGSNLVNSGVGPLFTGSNVRLAAYSGSTAGTTKPIISTSAVTALLNVNNGSALSDITTSYIAFESSAASVQVFIDDGVSTNPLTNIYFDNVDVTQTSNASTVPMMLQGSSADGRTFGSNYGLWNCNVIQPQNCLGGQVIFGSALNWMFAVGGNIAGGLASGPSATSHLTYMQNRTHMLGRWIVFGPSQNKNFCFNSDYNDVTTEGTASDGSVTGTTLTVTTMHHGVFAAGQIIYTPFDNQTACAFTQGVTILAFGTGGTTGTGGTGTYALSAAPTAGNFSSTYVCGIFATSWVDFTCYDGITYKDTANAFDADDVLNDPQGVQYRNFIASESTFHNLSAVAPIEALGTCTFRDNLNWGNVGTFLWQTGARIPLPSTVSLKFYRNKGYESFGLFLSMVNYSGTVSATCPFQSTDNSFWTTGATGQLTYIYSTNKTGTDSLVDRNNYWAPSSGSVCSDGGVNKSFAAWKALSTGVPGTNPYDANGTNIQPNWISPSTGDFSEPVVSGGGAAPSYGYQSGKVKGPRRKMPHA